jgi:hypothetical protein
MKRHSVEGLFQHPRLTPQVVEGKVSKVSGAQLENMFGSMGRGIGQSGNGVTYDSAVGISKRKLSAAFILGELTRMVDAKSR